ncbi:hypothetical protein [Acholeplasma hippikon]|nr:hypothetical protein [Acholeplasma hippikon]
MTKQEKLAFDRSVNAHSRLALNYGLKFIYEEQKPIYNIKANYHNTCSIKMRNENRRLTRSEKKAIFKEKVLKDNKFREKLARQDRKLKK